MGLGPRQIDDRPGEARHGERPPLVRLLVVARVLHGCEFPALDRYAPHDQSCSLAREVHRMHCELDLDSKQTALVRVTMTRVPRLCQGPLGQRFLHASTRVRGTRPGAPRGPPMY